MRHFYHQTGKKNIYIYMFSGSRVVMHEQGDTEVMKLASVFLLLFTTSIPQTTL
jgi:hypothetical protein